MKAPAPLAAPLARAAPGPASTPAVAVEIEPAQLSKAMVRPRMIHSVAPQLTREAHGAGIEGTVLVKCVVLIDGTLRSCRILRGLANMDEAVLAVMPQWRFTPAMVDGAPVEVNFVIPIKIVWKRSSTAPAEGQAAPAPPAAPAAPSPRPLVR